MNWAFWDSSALIPLCVAEATSAACHSLRRQYGQVVWWAAVVEIRSGIARGTRLGGLDAVQREEALNRLELLRVSWQEIVPGDELRDLAADSLDRYELRAADSLQLAAALIWCRRRPAGRLFICSDQRLGEAASLAGFKLLMPGSSTP